MAGDVTASVAVVVIFSFFEPVINFVTYIKFVGGGDCWKC